MRRTIFESEHDAFRHAVRTFLDRAVRPRYEQFRTERLVARDVWLEAGRQGFLGLEVAEEHGGSAADDYRFNAVFMEELAKVSAAMASCVGIHVDCVGPYLVQLGTPEQHARWLPGFCSGETVTAIAMTEPSGGTDLAALRTSAILDGDEWVVNGSKTFITNGGSADLVIVAARTTPGSRSKGITLFAVDAATPGFVRGPKLNKVGQPEADTTELFFTDMRVPAADVLGEINAGFTYMMERLPQERISAAVSNLAHAEQVLGETIAYAKDRRAFGQPIGSFQHNKFVLADLVTRVDVTRAFVDQCVSAHAAGSLSPIDAAKAKWWSAEVQNDVVDACVQLYGGYGYMTEYPAARSWMDARVTKIWAGSNEIMKEIIGRDLGL